MSADEIPEGEEVGDDLSEDESGSDDRESSMDRGSVELLTLNAVLSSISCFAYLSSDASNKEDIVYIHSSAIYEILLMLKPALDEAVRYGIAPDVKLKNVLVRLDDLINETRELLGSWHQLMSKVYLVIQNEPVIEKIRALAVYACQLLVPLYPSKRSAKIAESLVKKIQLVHYEKLLDIIKLSVEDQINKKLPRSDYLEKISNLLSLSSNQELLMEAVTLDRLKSKVVRSADRTEFEHLLALVTYMHDCFVKVKQLHSINGVPIPPDFCCPLSLELMSDPVIVASGQTYERAFIKNWLDQGFRVCPKTRQTLGHNNLIPNYTVKALIENWCETNKIKLPDPVKSMNENLPSVFIGSVDVKAEIFLPSTVYKDLASSNGIHRERYLLEKSTSPDSSLGVTSERDCDFARLSLSVPEDNKRQWRYDGQSSAHSNTDLSQSENHEVGDGRTVSRIDSDLTHTSSDVSGEGMQETANSVAPQIEPELMSKYTDVRSSSNAFWQRPSGRFTLNPKIISSPSSDTRPDLSGVESQVRKLVDELNCDAADVQRTATEELRLLAKHNMENRIVIANCGAIPLLVSLLHSTDPKTQENAVTALLNLSINDNNKAAIANADAIDPLIHVLKTGNAEAKENSAATLFSLSVIEENKVRIGRSGAINPLVDLLGNGTRRGKKDAATALFNLSIFHENKARIVQAGAVRHLVDLMDPAAGMVDKAVAVLANLATIPEGRTAIGQESGIPVLVEVVELGSARGKENAAAALLQLCTNSNKFCGLVLQEGAVPPLVALSQSGTPRGKEKAQALLSYFRNQRHGNAGRA